MGDRLSDGRVITGNPTDMKGDIPFVTPEGKKELKDQMYQDFLLAKSKGDIKLEYRFDTWCNRSRGVLEGHRLHDIKSELHMGKIGNAEFDALNEMRIKMIEAIKQFDFNDKLYDLYGIQHIDMRLKDAEMQVQESNETLPQGKSPQHLLHRPGVVKTSPDAKGKVFEAPLGSRQPEGNA